MSWFYHPEAQSSRQAAEVVFHAWSLVCEHLSALYASRMARKHVLPGKRFRGLSSGCCTGQSETHEAVTLPQGLSHTQRFLILRGRPLACGTSAIQFCF